MDAVGGVLADLGQGRFPAEPVAVGHLGFRVGGWTLGAHPGVSSALSFLAAFSSERSFYHSKPLE